MQIKISAFLVMARNSIKSPKNWTQGVSARDKNDKQVYYKNKDACKFCSSGAVELTYIRLIKIRGIVLTDNIIMRACRYLEQHTGNLTLPQYNDSRSHRSVIRVFNRAIEHAIKDENKKV